MSASPAAGEDLRITEFLQGIEERSATRIEPSPYGRGIFNEEFVIVWDMNFLRVEGSHPGVTADEIFAEVERLFAPAGYRHRKAMVEDAETGAALVEGFERLGLKATRLVTMVHRAEPDRRPAEGLAREVDMQTAKSFRTASIRQQPYADSEATVQTLVDAIDPRAAAITTRFFVGYAGDQMAAAADLYFDGRTAQIEDVATLEEYRGRGLARAVVLMALDEAYATGHDLVFLIADADDWPRELYAKLGFEPAGHSYEFLRTPPT